jgi:hypothetical protein
MVSSQAWIAKVPFIDVEHDRAHHSPELLIHRQLLDQFAELAT